MSDRNLDGIHLAHGSHGSPEDGLCAMEAAAWLAGEPHSDHPECVSPVIGEFLRRWNDGLGAGDRDRLLLGLVPLTLGTRDGHDAERAAMIQCWLVTEYAPAWLDLVPSLAHHATALRAVTDPAAAIATINAARAAAWATAGGAWATAAREAAWVAAGDAARAAAGEAAMAAAGAAWVAAGDAAREAARAAAGAAWVAAGDAARAAWVAAGDAARDAAREAARAARATAAITAAGEAAENAAGDAWEALAPTVATLQISACDLVRRMCALGGSR